MMFIFEQASEIIYSKKNIVNGAINYPFHVFSKLGYINLWKYATHFFITPLSDVISDNMMSD